MDKPAHYPMLSRRQAVQMALAYLPPEQQHTLAAAAASVPAEHRLDYVCGQLCKQFGIAPPPQTVVGEVPIALEHQIDKPLRQMVPYPAPLLAAVQKCAQPRPVLVGDGQQGVTQNNDGVAWRQSAPPPFVSPPPIAGAYFPRAIPLRERDGFTDDLAVEIARHNAVAFFPDGSQVSELGRMAALAAQEKAEQNATAPRVRISPPGSGNLGSTAVVQQGGALQQVVNWRADSEDDPIALTVIVAPLQDLSGNIQTRDFPSQTSNFYMSNAVQTVAAVASGTPQNRPFANVRWTIGKSAPFVAQVDVGKGVQLSIAASAVLVEVGLDAGNAAGAMAINGAIGFFAPNRQTSATRTLYLDSLIAKTFRNIIIPAGAQTVNIQTSVFNGGFTADIYDINSTLIYSYTVAASTQQTTPTPLSCDAYSITVTNNSAGAIANIRAVFGLSF